MRCEGEKERQKREKKNADCCHGNNPRLDMTFRGSWILAPRSREGGLLATEYIFVFIIKCMIALGVQFVERIYSEILCAATETSLPASRRYGRGGLETRRCRILRW